MVTNDLELSSHKRFLGESRGCVMSAGAADDEKWDATGQGRTEVLQQLEIVM